MDGGESDVEKLQQKGPNLELERSLLIEGSQVRLITHAQRERQRQRAHR